MNGRLEELAKGVDYAPIEGHPNHVVTKDGRIISLNQFKVMSTQVNASGYEIVTIDKKNHRVHRLVAQAFVGNPDNYPVINHVDSDKLNNHYSNLEWCTVEYNNREMGSRVKQANRKQYLDKERRIWERRRKQVW